MFHPFRRKKEQPAAPHIGDKAEDGWIYAGISEATGKPMYVAPEDTGIMNWHEALRAAAALEAGRHQDVRLPKGNELRQIFNNRAAIGGLQNKSTSDNILGYYWSSREYGPGNAVPQSFIDGDITVASKYEKFSVRFVRS